MKRRSLKKTNWEFNVIKNIFKRLIILIPPNEIKPYLPKAEKISPDPKDTIYFALALKMNCAIWSNDKKLKEQGHVRILSTAELIG